MRYTRVLGAVALSLAVVGAAGCMRGERPSETEPTLAPVPMPDEGATPGPPIVGLEQWLEIEAPVSLRPGEDGGVWYIVQRGGKIWRYDGSDQELIIDVSSEIQTDAEQGLYDFVISPDGRFAYIHFTGTEEPYGDHHLREYRWTGTTVEGEPREVLVIEDPYPHHNGGQLQFGPDDLLYIALGDGGTETLTQEEDNGDPHDHGQRTDELLGNVLRIDPRPSEGRDYTIPADNPFVGREGRDEIWSYGLRNPWRFSFDAETGDLWLPDVGHRFWEEINMQPAGSKGGQNYGWALMEGPASYKGGAPRDHVLPVFAYPHRGGPCAIIGGYVYRGSKIATLKGSYVFGDFCTGQLQAITLRNGEVVSHRYLGVDVRRLVALGEDHDGELFVMSYDDGIFRIVPAES